MTWKDIGTAPCDLVIEVLIPREPHPRLVYWVNGFKDASGDTCGGWQIGDDGEAPPSWSDGVCWASNADDEPSVKPTHWRPSA